MKTAAMITATLTHDPGNSEDAIRIRIRIRISCNKKLQMPVWKEVRFLLRED